MSIRIHQLSKKIGMDNKDLVTLLQQRGYQVTSASSTVDNISAESLVQEFGSKDDAAIEDADGGVTTVAVAAEPVAAPVPPDPEAAAPAAAPVSKMPEGVFVKSRDQIDQERREREAARAPVRPPPVAPAPVFRAPPPLPPRPPAVSPPPRMSSPQPMSPPSAFASSPAPASPPSPPPMRTGQFSPPSPVRPAPSAAAPLPTSPKPLGAPPQSPLSRSSSPPGVPSSGPAPVVVPGGPVLPPGEDVKVVQIKPPIVVRDFATLLGLKPFKLISELMEMGIFAALNQSIDEVVAAQVAVKHGFLLDIKHRGDQQAPKEKEKPPAPKEDESKLLELRPPVVCVMGHVDHGKTSLLDKIRSANVVAGEAGGITQHIGAYTVTLRDRKITFLDTPGHSAFNAMRARGANVTDIAVLVVAADDGFMPQTDEALGFIRKAEVTPVIAINKIDAKGANIDRVKSQMQERGLMPEDWGGDTVTVPVSAIRGDGIDSLLEMILLQADVLELKANPKAPATGVVIEAEIEVGRGPTATVLVDNGTLRTGDAVVCGQFYAKIRAMFDDQGKPVKEAGPSTAVRVIGWSGTPECGAVVTAVKNTREAERIAEEAEFALRKKSAAQPSEKPVSIENLFEAIAAQKSKVLRLVIKADVYGSAEAVVSVLSGIRSDKVTLEIVGAEVGQISKNDVLMASASNAAIIGFNVGNENGVDAVAKHHSVPITPFKIIYELVDRVREMMTDLLDPETRELKIGVAEVRAVFPISKGFVAGCLVTEGRVQVLTKARVRRGGKVEVETRVVTIRRVKDEVKEVRAGTECGIHLEGYDAYQPGDLIECFELQSLRPSL